MKRRTAILLLAATLTTLTLGGCRKTCTCIKNNGTTHTFTAEEVKKQNSSCQAMKYMYSDSIYDPMVSYYSVCEWD